MMTLDMRRRFYAEEIKATSDLHNPLLVEALATIPRERFLRAGPWMVRGEADFQNAPRHTPDADPSHVYHNLSVALDPARQLFNGAPGLIALIVDRLDIRPGERAIHIGCATGYYTALMAHCTGPTGQVLAIDVDADLAAEARANLASLPWVDVHHADGRDIGGSADAILVNAGMTHVLDVWLDALTVGGRLALPLTIAMTPSIGKGLMLLLTRTSDPAFFAARVIGFVAIYNAVAIRDDGFASQLATALRTQPVPALKRLRRDAHEPQSSCWLHRDGACLSTA